MQRNRFVDPVILKRLSKPRLYISLLQIAFEYVLVFTFIAISLYFANVIVTALMLCLIGARQQALTIVGHDAMHYRMSSNKKLNDIVANLLIFYPLWISLSDVRLRHNLHHQLTNTEYDPDYINKHHNIEYKFPQTKLQFLRNATKYIFGIHFIAVLFDRALTPKKKLTYFYRGLATGRRLDSVKYRRSTTETMLRYMFNIIILSIVIWYGALFYYSLFWLLPQIAYAPFIIRLRGINEHWGITKSEIEASRTMYTTWFDKLVLGISWNFGFHLDHHLYPSVPSYNLKKLHKVLLQNSDYARKAHITKSGTIGVFRECTV